MKEITNFCIPGKIVLSIMLCAMIAQGSGASSPEQAEICGQAATGDFEWTSQNFAGFYYDLDNNVGNERLITVLSDGKLSGDYPYGIIYETMAQEKPFSFKKWGSYSVIGFMGKKYFAGYLDSADTGESGLFGQSKESNTLAKGQLEEVLIDDDKEMTITTGRPLQLKDGYRLQLKDVDGKGDKSYVELHKENLSLGTSMVLGSSLVLQPDIYDDGRNTTIEQETYTYSIKLDSEKEAIIKVHLSGIFRGVDQNIVTIDRIWQSSENETSKVLIDSDDRLTITSSKPLQLEDGYELALKSVDIDGSKAYLELNRSDESVDARVVSVRRGLERDGRYNYYTNSNESRSKVIEVYFKSVFQDQKESLAIVDRIWQASQDDAASAVLNSTEKRIVTSTEPLKLDDGYEIILRFIDLKGNKAYVELHRNGEMVDAAIVEPPMPAEKDESFIYPAPKGPDEAWILAIHFKNVFRGSDLALATVDRIWQISEKGSKKDFESDIEANSDKRFIALGETIPLKDGYDLRLRSIDILGRKAYVELIKNGETIDFDIIYPIRSKEGSEIYAYAPDGTDNGEIINISFKSSFLGQDNLTSVERIWQSSQSQPTKVLRNSSDEVIISAARPLELEEGYGLKLRAVDVGGDQAYMELFKDGKLIDFAVVSSRRAGEADRTFTFSKNAGEGENLLLIAVHIKNAFAGADTNLGTVDGIWQISEMPLAIGEGDLIDKMKVQKVDSSSQSIAMANEGNQIALRRNMDTALMGDIRLRTADSDSLRYYICRKMITENEKEPSISGALGDTKPPLAPQGPVGTEPAIGSVDKKNGTDHTTGKAAGNAVKASTLAGSDGDEISVPDAKTLINTSEWGEVPANQVIVVLKDGKGRSDADQLAPRLGGRVVGFITYLNLYQIETTGSSEAELKEAILKAKGDPDVELAFPNQQIRDDTTVQGVQCSPLDDPVYAEGNRGKGYELIGVQNAWDLMRVSGVQLSDVTVGVVGERQF